MLEPGKFWGLDLAQEFLDAGLDYVGAELAAQKRPNLRVIGEAGLAAAKAARPDFIGAWHVCGKIPDQILDSFFGKVLGLMHAGTQAFLQFEDTGKREQLHGLAWRIAGSDGDRRHQARRSQAEDRHPRAHQAPPPQHALSVRARAVLVVAAL